MFIKISSLSTQILQAVYGGLAAVVFGLFLAYDTQVVLGGKRYELSEEEYIFGALQLYLDVVYLFLIALSLFGNKNWKYGSLWITVTHTWSFIES